LAVWVRMKPRAELASRPSAEAVAAVPRAARVHVERGDDVVVEAHVHEHQAAVALEAHAGSVRAVAHARSAAERSGLRVAGELSSGLRAAEALHMVRRPARAPVRRHGLAAVREDDRAVGIDVLVDLGARGQRDQESHDRRKRGLEVHARHLSSPSFCVLGRCAEVFQEPCQKGASGNCPRKPLETRAAAAGGARAARRALGSRIRRAAHRGKTATSPRGPRRNLRPGARAPRSSPDQRRVPQPPGLPGR
jgi:hypothetical protein